MIRVDKRNPDQIRDITIAPNPLRHAEGSALIELGNTKVLCAATLQDKPAPHKMGSGEGWLTAEYAMLPRSCAQRVTRDAVRGKVNSRGQEIQRLIGRSLRSIFRLDKFGERTMIIDCDVIEADGGTRTAAITGGFVALALAMKNLRERQKVGADLLKDFLTAVSVGIVEGQPVLDLCYLEDAQAEVDMNVAMTGDGKYVEIQGTAEGEAFDHDQMMTLLGLARQGCQRLVQAQKEAIGIESLDQLTD